MLGFICSAETLVLVKEKKTWEEALQHCRSLNEVDPGSVPWKKSFDLATLITPDDHKFARERAQEAMTEEVGELCTLCCCYCPFHCLS